MGNTAPVKNVIDNFAGIPAGSPGDLVSPLQSTRDTVFFDQATNTPDAYGIPLVMVAGVVRKFVLGNDGTSINGALVRTDPDRTELDGSPNVSQPHGRIIRGAFLGTCAIGTPVRDHPVYVRTVADAGKLVGDLEATEVGGENVAIPGWVWHVGGKDAANLAVIRIGA